MDVPPCAVIPLFLRSKKIVDLFVAARDKVLQAGGHRTAPPWGGSIAALDRFVASRPRALQRYVEPCPTRPGSRGYRRFHKRSAWLHARL